ncbi:hypothetical protein NODU109028_18555 [Nocardioides dubius]
MPRIAATSAGFWPSTSVCHSTSCQRSGSEANAFAAASFSKPSMAVSRNGTPGSKASMSSVVCSRALPRIRSTCRRRIAVSR